MPLPGLEHVRSRAADLLSEKVGGARNAERAERIWGTPGPRWFEPGSPITRVHASGTMFVAGPRALFLQSLHPLAMAGVADHSGYRSNPWGRLQNISEFLSVTTFGTIEDAERTIERINRVHAHIAGTAPDGRPYRADDPHLLRWVHAAEIDSFLTCYQQYAPQPLSAADADTYVAQTGSVVRRLGVISPPSTVAELDATLAAYRSELAGTPEALDTARYLMFSPPMPVTARPAYGLLVAGAIATLPPYAREMLRLRVPPGGTRVLAGLGKVGARTMDWILAAPSVAKSRRRPS